MKALLPLMTPNLEARFWKYVKKGPGCWLWIGGHCVGYGVFHLGDVAVKAHRLSFVLDQGAELQADRPCVLHRCDNPPCVRPDHLYAGTHQDNMDDAWARGRMVKLLRIGEDNHASTLTDHLAREIVRLHHDGLGYGRIAQTLDVTKRQVSLVLTGQSWTHVTGIEAGTRHYDRVPRAAMTPNQAVSVRVLLDAGFRQRWVARWLGINRNAVRRCMR